MNGVIWSPGCTGQRSGHWTSTWGPHGERKKEARLWNSWNLAWTTWNTWKHEPCHTWCQQINICHLFSILDFSVAFFDLGRAYLITVYTWRFCIGSFATWKLWNILKVKIMKALQPHMHSPPSTAKIVCLCFFPSFWNIHGFIFSPFASYFTFHYVYTYILRYFQTTQGFKFPISIRWSELRSPTV